MSPSVVDTSVSVVQYSTVQYRVAPRMGGGILEFFPVLGEDGTTKAPRGDIFDQNPLMKEVRLGENLPTI